MKLKMEYLADIPFISSPLSDFAKQLGISILSDMTVQMTGAA